MRMTLAKLDFSAREVEHLDRTLSGPAQAKLEGDSTTDEEGSADVVITGVVTARDREEQARADATVL